MEKFNKRRFILKGSLTIEGYFEVYGNDKINLYNEYYKKLRKYYDLKEKDKKSVDYMYKELKTLINNLGKEHFLIYEDGDVNYIYLGEKNNH